MGKEMHKSQKYSIKICQLTLGQAPFYSKKRAAVTSPLAKPVQTSVARIARLSLQDLPSLKPNCEGDRFQLCFKCLFNLLY